MLDGVHSLDGSSNPRRVTFICYTFVIVWLLQVAATADKQIHVYDLNSGNKVCFV